MELIELTDIEVTLKMNLNVNFRGRDKLMIMRYYSKGSYVNKSKIDMAKNTEEFVTLRKEFYLLRGVTVRLLCFAENSMGRATSRYFVKGGMYEVFTPYLGPILHKPFRYFINQRGGGTIIMSGVPPNSKGCTSL